MNENLFEVLRAFRLDAKPVSCEPYGCGHINVTYLAVTESGAISCKKSTTTRSATWRG